MHIVIHNPHNTKDMRPQSYNSTSYTFIRFGKTYLNVQCSFIEYTNCYYFPILLTDLGCTCFIDLLWFVGCDNPVTNHTGLINLPPVYLLKICLPQN